MSEVSRFLEAAQQGDRQAAADLLPLVYDELRKLAASAMAAESPGHTLDATALVHEAYRRLVGDQQFDGRGHFFAAAAKAMRRILIDCARKKHNDKRGGNRARAGIEPDKIANPERSDDLIALDEALSRLATHDPRKAKLVELRYFAGLLWIRSPRCLGYHRRPPIGIGLMPVPGYIANYLKIMRRLARQLRMIGQSTLLLRGCPMSEETCFHEAEASLRPNGPCFSKPIAGPRDAETDRRTFESP